LNALAMSAKQCADLVAQALKAGAAACLQKPVDVQQVRALFKVPMAIAVKR
jgi:DNA-binding NtrC family response regulator